MLSELNVLKDASHPHIMRVVEILHDSKMYYIASEILKGGELQTRIEKFHNTTGTVPEKNAAHVM